ncbi:RHS domain-containing protein [uncultured Comamonas sp.]|uniref:RHS domain-containing protein n=1 Tax=uncultured Comamonas sp. TaxID=114710 RepID=UPI003748710F
MQLATALESPYPHHHHYYHCDHLGTPLALTDANGQIVWAASLDPWGNVLDESTRTGLGSRFVYRGRSMTWRQGFITTGIGITTRRWGGYITQDPIGLEGGANTYMYAISNPNAFIDAFGLFPEREKLKDTAEKITSAKETVEGAQQIVKGTSNLKTHQEKKDEIYDCLRETKTCAVPGEKMQQDLDNSRRTALEGYKDIANGSVNIYKNTPGTLGNGPPSVK